MAQSNELMPAQGAPVAGPPAVQATPAGAPPGGADPFVQYDKLMAAGKLLDAVQAGLMSLHDLGDTVSGEDVTHVAGELVAQGLDATAMAGMLAEMPEKGELLAQWVEEHLADLAEREAQLDFVTKGLRQQMGVDAMRGLMAQFAQNGG